MPIDDFFFNPPPPLAGFYRIKADPSFPDVDDLSSGHVTALLFLIMRLMYLAGDVEPMNADGVCAIELTKNVSLVDGYLAPFCLYYRMIGSEAWLLAFDLVASDEVEVSSVDLDGLFRSELQKLMVEKGVI